MPEDPDDDELAEHVADRLRAAGLTAHVWRRRGNAYVGVQRGGAESRRALLWVVGTDRAVTGRSVESFAALCDREDVADCAVLAAGRVADDASAAARDAGVGLVGPDPLRSFLEDPEVSALLPGWEPRTDAPDPGGTNGMRGTERSGTAEPGRRDDADPDSPGLLDRLRTAGYGRVAGLAVVGVLVLVALVLGAAILGGLSGGGGMTFAANSTVDGDAADVLVAWDAGAGAVADANPNDSRAVPAPNGSKFVVVGLELTNVGGDEVPLRAGDFALSVNGTRHGYQPLAGHEPFPRDALPGGTTVNATLVYRVPADATSATLVVDDRLGEEFAVLFEHDTDVTPGVAVRESG